MDIVITTIFPPTPGAIAISQELAKRGGTLWVMGDRKGPTDYPLPQVRFVDIESQLGLPFRLARRLAEKSYTRKNLGYLLAIEQGAHVLVETDDDNVPLPGFWEERRARLAVRRVLRPGWCNVYRYFSDARIWPRGFPLEEINPSLSQPLDSASLQEAECLVQQALADANPDVDAVYRLTSPLPIHFEVRDPVALAGGCWCPFNSQNTTFFAPAFPLLYLPSGCTFRMTDIWRSFVAQRCLWAMDSQLAFTPATMRQERNEHHLLRDFEDEVPGYLHNQEIRMVLESLSLQPGRNVAEVCENLQRCYAGLVQANLLPERELELVDAWIQDLRSLVG